MAEIDNTIALQGKPPPQQDIVGPITSIAQLQYLQANAQRLGTETQGLAQQQRFAGAVFNAKQNYVARIQRGEDPASAVVTSGLSGLSPQEADAAIKNVQQTRTLAAYQRYAENPSDVYSLAGAGPDTVSKAADVPKTLADMSSAAMTQRAQVANEFLASVQPDGTIPSAIRADAIKRAAAIPGIDPQTIKWAQTAPDASLIQIAKSWQAAGPDATKAGAETLYGNPKYGPGEYSVMMPGAAGLAGGLAGGASPSAPPAPPGAVATPAAPRPGAPAVAPTAAPAAESGMSPQSTGAGKVGGTSPQYYFGALTNGDVQSALRASEGLRTDSYWDVNHWRTGYGSDTVTRADGSVEPVTATTTITPQDAERDLQRRTALAGNLAKTQIGDAWGNYGPNAQAALTSMVYNYGRLPSDVAKAAATGNPRALSTAIANHAGDNNGANAARRLTEARAVLGPLGQAGPQGQGAAPFMAGLPQSGSTPLQTAGAMPVPAGLFPRQGQDQGRNPLAPAPPPQGSVAPVSSSPPTPAPIEAMGSNSSPSATQPNPSRPDSAVSVGVEGSIPIGTAAGQTGPQTNVPRGAIVIGQPMTVAQKAEQEKTGSAYGELPQKLDDAASAARAQNASLDQLQNATEGWRQGKWSDVEEDARETMQAVGKAFGVDTSAFDRPIANYQDFVKLSGQVLRQAAHDTSSRVGVQEMQLIAKSLPNPEMSEGGLKLVASQMKGLNDFAVAKQQAASQWRTQNGTLGPGRSGVDFQSEWNNNASPAAFVAHRLQLENPQAFDQMIQKMSNQPGGKAALKNLLSQMQWASQKGLLND